MNITYKSDTRNRKDWAVTIYKNHDSPKFYAKCISSTGETFYTEFCKDKGSAWQSGYDLVDKEVRKKITQRFHKIAIPLTIALLYVSGNDEYQKEYNNRRKFLGRNSWKGYDFAILDLLEEQELIQKGSNRTKSVYLTKEGIKKARDVLRNLNLEVEEFLQAHSEHDNLS